MQICIENATKYIKRALILDNVSADFHGGMIYGLQGPNGSGKTMLMRLIAGLIRPTEGTVTIDRRRLGKDMDFPTSMGLLIEEPAFLNNHTGIKNLELLASIRNKASSEDIRQAIQDAGLNPDDKRVFGKYSLGMKKRLGIAAAIMEKPDLILLDEPTNALDETGTEQICNLIRRERDRGALVMVACHDAQLMEALADEIYSLYEGKVKRKVRP